MALNELNYGEWIRRRRREKGLSLDAVSEATRIDRQYLEALEAGNIALLPEPYMRAFLKTYATYLGLDGTEAVRRFELFVTEQNERLEKVRSTVRDKEGRRSVPPAAREPERSVPRTPPPTPGLPKSRGRGGFGRLVLPVGVLIVVAVALVLVLSSTPEPPAGGETQPGVAPGPATATPAADTTAAGTATEPPPAPPEDRPAAPVVRELVAEALEDTWMQAVADGDTVVTRVIAAGARVEIAFTDTLRIKLGKNRGMRLWLDEAELTDLGSPGFILALLLTTEGVVSRRLTYPPETIPDYLNIPPVR